MRLRSNIGKAASVGTGTNITVTKPTDAKAGDTIWVCIKTPNSGNPHSAPDGTWTQLESIEIFTPQTGTMTLWEKVLGTTEPSSYTFTQVDNTDWATIAFAAKGRLTRYNNDSGTDTTGSTHASGAITTKSPHDIVVSFFGQDNTGSNGSWAPSLPTNLTLIDQIWGNGNVGLGMFIEKRVTAGSSSHEVTQTTGGDNTRGSTWAIFAIHFEQSLWEKLLDNFNRGNSTDPSSGGWPWIQGIHSGFPQSHDIVSNALKAPTSGFGSDYWAEYFAMDQAAEFTVVAAPTNVEFRVIMRMANPGVDATVTGYEFCIDPSNSYIVRTDATYARTTLATTGVGFSAGHRLRAECRGDLLSLYRDSGAGWVHLATVSDDTYIRGGYIGLITANDTAVTIDDFWAGDMGGPIFPQRDVIDNFNRSNGDPGAEWSTAFVATPAKPAIDTNVLKSGGAGSANSGMYWNVEEVSDGEAYFTVPTLPSPTTEDIFLTFRAMNTARNAPPPNSTSWSGYQLHYNDTFLILRKYDGTSATTLYTSWSLPFAAGDGLGVQFHGSTIRLYWKSGSKEWTQLGPEITDDTYTGGYLGIEFDESACRIDNFGGGVEPAFSGYALGVQLMNPTSYWRFSEGSLNDVGPAKRKLVDTGTIIAVPSIIPSEEAAPNSAMEFFGSAGLQTPDAAAYGFNKPSPDWTILFWMKITSPTFGTGFQRMFEKRDAGWDVQGYLYYGQDARNYVAFDTDPGVATAEGFGVQMDLPMNIPIMMTVTWEAVNGTVRCYRNDQLISSKSDFTYEADLFHANGEKFTIGWDSGLISGNAFIGVMDDFAIWEGRRLTDGEISDIYESGINLNASRSNYFATRRKLVQR